MNNRRIRWLGLASLANVFSLSMAVGCQQQQSQDNPNRVLDRPTDMVLTCARIYCTDDDDDTIVDADECRPQAVALDDCKVENFSSCTSLPIYNQLGIGIGDYQLFGFIANSERNEVAMFAECANRLIDMNVETPGYNFVPTGVLPTNVDASANGCRVLSANVGSCDLTVLDSEGLAGFGLGLALAVDEPSSLVANLVPTRFDVESQSWLPIGARPAELIAVPNTLSTSPPNTGELSDSKCDSGERGSVYVSFPTCNLVAEIDVQTGHVLQSRQFVSDDEGVIDVIDTGVTPICPVECPSQFDGDLPDDLPEIDQDGPFPQALALLNPDRTQSEEAEKLLDEADKALDNQALFVGGLGSDLVFEIRMTEAGDWTEDTQSLELQGASGVSRIRISPPVELVGDDRQFLYVIVGDGSTRVIARALDISEGDPLGIECDTQRDLVTGASDLACFPVDDASNVERRALVGGPGIRASNGADVTDWTFVKVREAGSVPEGVVFTLFFKPGVFAVGTTTRGEVVYSMINQARVSETTTEAILTATNGLDPIDLMRVELAPHSLWPDPNLTPAASLPAVRDQTPQRSLPADYGPSRNLAPSLRLIDYAYAGDERRSALLGNFVNNDLLGGGTTPLYGESVARIAVHDYRAWAQSDWRLEWEGVLIGAQSSGRIACDSPGWEGGTCRVEQPDDARLHDSAAKFCDSGVLPGDKLVLLGCAEDSQCGEGRRCLRETAGGGDSTGICVSAEAFESSAANLRVICADFIRDPCGEAHREYTITKAFQDELWIQSMDIPVTSTIVPIEDSLYPACATGINNWSIDGECVCRIGFVACSVDPDGDPDSFDCCVDPDAVIPPVAEILEDEARWLCAEEQPEGGCVEDDECDEITAEGEWRCIEERCRRACENPSECMLRPLPGPTCFGEFVPYQVALHNSFLVDGPLVALDRVDVDPDTGECVPTKSIENSALLTSRLPLPPTSDSDDPDWNAIPLCPTNQVLPTDPNPCRIHSTSAYAPYHLVNYVGEPVQALRFSNPLFSIVVDLTSLEALTDDVPTYDASTWPAEFAAFRRSRIPRGYEQEFSLAPGYQAFADLVSLESRAVTLPMRVVSSPLPLTIFIVDGAGPGTSSGIRGQVVRATLSDGDATVDTAFNGVR